MNYSLETSFDLESSFDQDQAFDQYPSKCDICFKPLAVDEGYAVDHETWCNLCAEQEEITPRDSSDLCIAFDQYPSKCDICFKPLAVDEGYAVDHETWCNLCAEQQEINQPLEEEVQYPSKCDICFKPLTVDEGYAVDNETWCNLCAEQQEINQPLEEEVQYPSKCDICLKPLTVDEGYAVDNETWCNLCAEQQEITQPLEEEAQYPSKCDICLKPLTVDEGYAVDKETWCNLCAEQQEINNFYSEMNYPHDSSDLCWGPDCQSQALDEDPSKCDICLKPLTDHEGYAVDNETWCNLCAEQEEITHDRESSDLAPQCYWGPNCIKCQAQALDEDRYPSKCDICLKPLTDHEGYSDDHETWCNLCAEQQEINHSYCEMNSNDDDTIISSTNDLHANTRSRCDDTSPLNFITCCNCGAEECSDYSYNYKSSVYCNKCAVEVCGEKSKFAFNVVVEKKTFKCARCADNHDWYERNMVDGNLFCGPCYWYLEIATQIHIA